MPGAESDLGWQLCAAVSAIAPVALDAFAALRAIRPEGLPAVGAKRESPENRGMAALAFDRERITNAEINNRADQIRNEKSEKHPADGVHAAAASVAENVAVESDHWEKKQRDQQLKGELANQRPLGHLGIAANEKVNQDRESGVKNAGDNPCRFWNHAEFAAEAHATPLSC